MELWRACLRDCAANRQDSDTATLTRCCLHIVKFLRSLLGFSPFELLHARAVRGPMFILKELWMKELEGPEVKNSY